MNAARIGDAAVATAIPPLLGPGNVIGPGVATVVIEKLPAVVVGDHVAYAAPGGPAPLPIIKGSSSVFIGKRPAARMGDLTVAGSIVMGAGTVMIGG